MVRPCLPFPKGGGRESWKTDKKAGEKEERCREAKLSRSSSAVRVDLPSPPPLASEAVSLRLRRLVSSSSSKECLLVSFSPSLVAPIISLALPRPPHFADTFLRRRDDANKEEEAAASDSELKPSILFQFTTYDRDQIALVTILTAISTAA